MRPVQRRPDYRCNICWVNLGPNPWKGTAPDLWTECGCYPKPQEQKMRLPSQGEKITAILDARQDVAQYLTSIGKIEIFANFTKDEICGLIRAAQDGVQASLKRQIGDAMDGEIPF